MIKRTLWIALLILCSFSCVRAPQKGAESGGLCAPEWYTTDSLRAAYFYTEGIKYATLEEDTTKSLAYLRKVLEIDSLHGPTHHQLSVIYDQIDPKKALKHGAKAFASDSTNLDYQYQYGYTLAINGEYEKARSCHLDLIEKDPKNYLAYYQSALLYAMTGMPHMALSIIDSAEYKLGGSEYFTDMRQNILIMMGQKDRAVEELRKVCENTPYEPQNWVTLCKRLLEMGRIEEADEAYQKAVELAPGSASIQLDLALAYYAAGGAKQFLELAKSLFLNDNAEVGLKLLLLEETFINDMEFYGKNFYPINTLFSILHIKHPENLLVQEEYSSHLILAGEVERAVEIQKQLARNPNNENRKEAYYMVLSMEEFLTRTDSVTLYLDEIIELYPTDSTPYMYKGFMCEDEGDFEQAEKHFRRAVEVASDPETKSLAYVTLADHLATQAGNLRKAERYYRKALELNPDNTSALNNWAYYSCLGGGDLERALEMSTRACELEPSNATFLDTKGWILHLMGRNEEAKKVMRQAISLDMDNSSELLLHYADILAASGETYMAQIYYKRALEAGADPTTIHERIENLSD